MNTWSCHPARWFTPTRSAPVVLALLACYLVWGSTYLAIRVALVSFPPFFQMGSRFLVAGLLLMGWVLGRRVLSSGDRPAFALPTARQWAHAGVIGSLMLGAGMGLTAQASVAIGSGLIAACIAVVPMMIGGWGLLWGRRPSAGECLGMVLGLGGVLLLVRGASFAASPLSMLCMVGATAAWSLGSVLSTTRYPLAPGAAGFASEMLCGGVVLLAVSWALGERPSWPPQPAAAAAWLYLVVLGSLVAFSAYLYLLRHASPALASSYAFVNPLIALLLGSVVAGEAVSPREWMACGVIMTAVLVILLARQSRRA